MSGGKPLSRIRKDCYTCSFITGRPAVSRAHFRHYCMQQCSWFAAERLQQFSVQRGRTPAVWMDARTRFGSPRSFHLMPLTFRTVSRSGTSARTRSEKLVSSRSAYSSFIIAGSSFVPNQGIAEANALYSAGVALAMISINASADAIMTKLFQRQPRCCRTAAKPEQGFSQNRLT